MTGGRPTDIDLLDDSVFVMHDGILGEAIVTDGSSRALINGGIISQLVISRGNSVLNIRGGRLPERVRVFENATINIYGIGLYFTVDPDSPQISLLGGRLADGTPIGGVRYQMHDQGRIILHEVPEPTTRVLLALGAMGLLCWRVRRRAQSSHGNPPRARW
jgi:hypothetical protein